MPNNSREASPIMALKLIGVGNSTGVILPKEVLDSLNVAKGDTVFITKSPDGIRITPFDPAFEARMAIARKIMKKRRNVLRELAK